MEEHMKITDTIIEPPVYGYKFPQNKEEILFLDIETTGLSPDASSLYMIGLDNRSCFYLDGLRKEQQQAILDVVNRLKDLFLQDQQ